MTVDVGSAILEVRDAIRASLPSPLPPEPAGEELCHAAMTAMFTTTSASPVEVPGLTVPFQVGTRPVEFRLSCDLTNSTATGTTTAYLVVDGYTRARAQHIGGSAAWHTHYKAGRVADLTPGTLHTAQIMLSASAGSTAYIGGDPVNPVWSALVTL